MKLSIIIPHYNEYWYEIEPLLNSIAAQQGIEFGYIDVYIINDGNTANSLLGNIRTKDWPFKLHVYTLAKSGVSAARNFGLASAKDADYVMFCDADDMFCHAMALHMIFIEMETGFDMLVSNFAEECRKDEKIVYITHEKDFTFVHGKVYRRQYLLDNNLYFDTKLQVHEDGCFNVLVGSFTNNVRYLPVPIYLWKWRKNSVARHEDNFVLRTLDKFIDAGDSLIENLEHRGCTELARQNVCSAVVGFYFMFNSPQWLGDEYKELRPKAGERLYRYLTKYAKYWQTFDEDMAEILFNMRIYKAALTVENAREQIIQWAKDFIV